MLKLLAILIYTGIIALLFDRCVAEHQTQSLPMVQAAHPIAKSNLLFTPCPLTPKNIPLNRERTT